MEDDRKKFNFYLSERIVREFENSIKDTGFSMSRMVELMMRANVSKEGKTIGEIFDKIFDMGERIGKKAKK